MLTSGEHGVTEMNDWIADYNDYSGFKDVAGVLEDARKLRSLYSGCRFEEMYQHIRVLMGKYPVETITWNAANTSAPRNADEAFRAADEFLRRVAVLKVEKYLNC